MSLQSEEACEELFSDWYQLHGGTSDVHQAWQAAWGAALAWNTKPPLFTRCCRWVIASVVYALRWLITSDTKEELQARFRGTVSS